MNSRKKIPDCSKLTIFNVDYHHLKLDDGDEFYFTDDGLPYWENLLPENFWTDKEWFKNNFEMQRGSGCVYKIRTKEVDGHSLDIIMKWNRMGKDIPGDTEADAGIMDARFLSPFEEFHYLQELRNQLDCSNTKIALQYPLAIYVPSGHVQARGRERRQYLLDFIQKNHEHEIAIDLDRTYIVIYKWMEEINIEAMIKDGQLSYDEVVELTQDVYDQIIANGFVVRDHKASHIIVKTKDGEIRRDRQGHIEYGYVDYELMERTPERERISREIRRRNYLERMPKRFEETAIGESELKPCSVFDVPYIFGEVPSSKGRLWVVGRDPGLFDYFLPEKWRKQDRVKLSQHHNMYYKVSRDNINLVLKLSRVGEMPDVDPFKQGEKKILEHGFNSPFEEVAIALELSAKGIPVIYPRAIYMSGEKSGVSSSFSDQSRYLSHEKFLIPGGSASVLTGEHEYIIIWGYWNGTDEMLAEYDGNYYKAVNALSAFRNGLIDEATYISLMKKVSGKMRSVGVEDLHLRGTHILLSIDSEDKVVLADDGMPNIRICNFELLRKISRGRINKPFL